MFPTCLELFSQQRMSHFMVDLKQCATCRKALFEFVMSSKTWYLEAITHFLLTSGNVAPL